MTPSTVFYKLLYFILKPKKKQKVEAGPKFVLENCRIFRRIRRPLKCKNGPLKIGVESNENKPRQP